MISCEKVRELARSLPEVEEQEHWGRPSFRVGKKIFATLWEDEKRAVVKLPLDEMDVLVKSHPKTFSAGPWKHQGWTGVELKTVGAKMFREVLIMAWRGVAPKRVAAACEE